MNNAKATGGLVHNVAWLVPICTSIVLGAYGLVGVVATALVIAMACVGFFLHLTGKISFVAPKPVKIWAAIVLFYVLVGIGGLALQHQPGESIGNTFNRLSFLTFLPLTAVLFLPSVKALLSAVKLGALIGGLLVFSGAMLEYSFVRDRVWLGAGNQGPFSVVSAVGFILCTFFALKSNNLKERTIYGIASLAACVCILLSGMRNMMPALVLVPLIGLAVWKQPRPEFVSKNIIAMIIIAIATVIILAAWLALPRFEALLINWDKANIAQNYDTSLGRRIVMYDYALQAIPANPWFGIGNHNMTAGLNSFSISQYGFSLEKTHLHNFVLNALVQGGVVELLSLIALILAPLLLTRGPYRDEYSRFGMGFMLAVTAVYLLSGTLNIMFSHDILDMMYMTCAAFSIALVFRERSPLD